METEWDKMTALNFNGNSFDEDTRTTWTKLHQSPSGSKKKFPEMIEASPNHICVEGAPYLTSDGVKTVCSSLISNLPSSICSSISTIIPPACNQSQIYSQNTSSVHESILPLSKGSEKFCSTISLSFSKCGSKISRSYVPTKCLQKPNVTISKSCHFKKVKRNKHIFSPKSINLAISVQNKFACARQSHSYGSKNSCFKNGKCKIQNLSQATVLFVDKFGSLKFEKHSSSALKSSCFKFSCKKCSIVLSRRNPQLSFTSKLKMNSKKRSLAKSNTSYVKISCVKSDFVPSFSESDPQFFRKYLGNIDNDEKSNFFCDILSDCKIRIDVQGGGKEYPRLCYKCYQVFAHDSSFARHITSGSCQRSNPNPKEKQKESLIVCSKCSTAYVSQSCYKRHLKTSCQNTKVAYIPCVEPSCNIKFRLQSTMIRHLAEGHGIDLGVQKKTFASMEEFEKWKRLEERRTFTMLTRRRGEYKLGGQSGKRCHYFSCIFNVQERRRVPRKFKDKPENTNCPAKIDALEGPDDVQVTYYSYHNHELKEENLKFCHLDRKTRKYIDKLIENKVPAKKIREELTTNHLDSEDLLPVPENFITLTQISRMKHRLTANKKMSKEDALSVQHVLNVLYADKPDSILIYKPQGKAIKIGNDITQRLSGHDLFVLGIQEERQRVEMINSCRKVLCIDMNHIPRLHNFYLINVLVQDEFNEGYPVAHFVTNSIDSKVLTAFFNALKLKSPHLEINAFMSNDNPTLYNAFSQVFENKPVHFLCKSNLKRSWFNQLNEKIEDPQLVSEIYSCLEVMLEENNYETFLETLSNFVSKYESVCPDFCEHFSTHYAKNSESWAMCFRNIPYAPADSSEFCEFFRKRLKLVYINRKVSRKVGDLIDILSEVHNNFHLALSYKRLTNEVPTNEDNENHCRHWEGMSVPDEDVKTSGKLKFKVKSESPSGSCHTVTITSDRCSVPSVCYIQCHKSPCYPLCWHMYSCSCEDTNALCKHIHKVHSLVKSKSSSNTLEKSKNESDDSDTELSFRDVPKKQITPPELSEDEKLLASTQTAFSELQALLMDPKTKPLSHHINTTLKSLVSECNGFLSSKLVPKKVPETCVAPPPTSDHTYIDLTNKAQPETNEPRPAKTVMVVERIAKPAAVNSRKRTVIRIPLKSTPKVIRVQQSDNFSGTLKPTDSLTKPLFKSNQYEIKLYHLKSLDLCLCDKDLSRIRSEVPGFKKGCLYDCIIYSYLMKIAESFPSVKIVAPSVSQVLASSDRDVLIMIPFANYEKILILCNPDDTHWLLLVVYPKLKELHFFDPKCRNIEQHYHQLIGRWVHVLSKNSSTPISEWKVLAPMHVCQSDSLNCGVFVSWYADQVIKNLSTVGTFSVDAYRKQMYQTLKALVPDSTT